MTFDKLNQKFENLQQKTGIDVRKSLLDEFGSFSQLAFELLEADLFDATKYSGICLYHQPTHDSATSHAEALRLSRLFEQFKNDFNKRKN